LGVPKGQEGEISTSIVPAKESQMQVRYFHLHPSKVKVECPSPERWRWGKAPPTYRGLRKIWVAEDLSRKSRTQISPAQVVRDPVPALGLVPANSADEVKAEAATDSSSLEKEKKSCGCRVPGAASAGASVHVATLLALWGIVLRMRRRSSALVPSKSATEGVKL
jgi:hypothetical protein